MRLLYTFLLMLSSTMAFSQLIWVDDFDGSSAIAPVLNSPLCNGFFNGSAGYWGIMCDMGGGCGNEIHSSISPFYGSLGATGNQFLGALNTDLQPFICGPPDGGQETAEWFGIDISSCSGNTTFLCLDLAKATDYDYIDQSGNPVTPGGWDGPSKVRLIVWVDNNPFVLATFEQGGGINSPAGLDTNCNEMADDGITIPNSLTTFCFRMPEGNTTDILIEIDGLNEPSEDIAIDNVAIYCGSAPTTAYIPDFDCDGVPGYADCNDISAAVTSSNINDGDCDGFLTVDDCDDNDPTITVATPCNTDPCLGDLEILDPNDICSCIVDVIQVLGCTDITATNFNVTANCDDGSCLFPCPPLNCDDGDCTNGLETWDAIGCQCVNGVPPTPCLDDLDCSNGDEVWNTVTCICENINVPDPTTCIDDLNCVNGIETWNTITCTCEQLNIPNPSTCVDDMDCSNGLETWNIMTCNCDVAPSILGCTDPLFANYNPLATCDDGSCTCPVSLNLTGIVPANLYEASDHIISNGQVISNSNGNVTFHAGNYIDLAAGFEADATFQFTAEIFNCQ